MANRAHTTIRGTFTGMPDARARMFLFELWQGLQDHFKEDVGGDFRPYFFTSMAFPDLRTTHASAIKLRVASSRVPEYSDSSAFAAFDGEKHEIADCGPAGELALAMVLLAREHDGWDAVVSCQAPPAFRRRSVAVARLIQPDLPVAEWMVASPSTFVDPVWVPDYMDFRV